MGEILTYREIAERLGISRTLVEIIERRALAKLAMALGETNAFNKLPKWIKSAGRLEGQERQPNRCKRCGETGHNIRSCGRDSKR